MGFPESVRTTKASLPRGLAGKTDGGLRRRSKLIGLPRRLGCRRCRAGSGSSEVRRFEGPARGPDETWAEGASVDARPNPPTPPWPSPPWMVIRQASTLSLTRASGGVAEILPICAFL